MASKLQPSAIILLLLAVLPAAVSHNITRILSETPNFGTFNSLLSRTHIAAEINRRQTITVLALDDSAAGGLSLPEKTLSQVLSLHVVLDYYDVAKLKALKRRSTLLTTLFQTTGVAKNSMGFVNMTRLDGDRLAFGSGVPGTSLGATFVKSVAARPYNISVLQISAAIVPPGIETAATAPFGAPVKEKKPRATASEPSPADAPEVESPADEPDEENTPGGAPEAEEDDVAPSADDDDDDEDSSSAGRVASGVSLLMAAGVAFLSL